MSVAGAGGVSVGGAGTVFVGVGVGVSVGGAGTVLVGVGVSVGGAGTVFVAVGVCVAVAGTGKVVVGVGVLVAGAGSVLDGVGVGVNGDGGVVVGVHVGGMTGVGVCVGDGEGKIVGNVGVAVGVTSGRHGFKPSASFSPSETLSPAVLHRSGLRQLLCVSVKSVNPSESVSARSRLVPNWNASCPSRMPSASLSTLFGSLPKSASCPLLTPSPSESLSGLGMVGVLVTTPGTVGLTPGTTITCVGVAVAPGLRPPVET